MQCQIKNTGTVPAGMCVEVVKVGKSGDHAAYVCTDRMNPGEVESRVVDNVDPKVKFLESCYGVEYGKKHIDKSEKARRVRAFSVMRHAVCP